jgi:hypothetical protein
VRLPVGARRRPEKEIARELKKWTVPNSAIKVMTPRDNEEHQRRLDEYDARGAAEAASQAGTEEPPEEPRSFSAQDRS